MKKIVIELIVNEEEFPLINWNNPKSIFDEVVGHIGFLIVEWDYKTEWDKKPRGIISWEILKVEEVEE